MTRPPPLPPEPEVVVVEEEPAPSTQRHPVIPPPPREPFIDLTRKIPNNAQLMAKLDELVAVTAKAWATGTEVLHVQRKMARQTDGLVQSMNGRMDIFHRELALLRGLGDEVPVADRAPPSRARLAALVGGKYTAVALVGAFVLRVIGRKVPELNHLIEDILGAFGL